MMDVPARVEFAPPVSNAGAPPAGVLRDAAAQEAGRLASQTRASRRMLLGLQQPKKRPRSLIGRHPILFGTLVGFTSGFLIGYLPGDDAVFDDFTAGFNGLVLGGAGAAVGAGVGAIVGAVTKDE